MSQIEDGFRRDFDILTEMLETIVELNDEIDGE